MTQALVVNSASKSILSSPARAALAAAPNCKVTGVAASSTSPLSGDCGSSSGMLSRDCVSINLSCLQPDWINIVDTQHGELPTVNALSQTCRDANGEKMVLDCSPRQHDCPLTRTWRDLSLRRLGDASRGPLRSTPTSTRRLSEERGPTPLTRRLRSWVPLAELAATWPTPVVDR